MFGIIKEIFSVLLTGIVSACNHRKCFSLSNHKRMTQPTLIDLYPNEYTQKSHYYPFVVKLDRCMGSSNNLYDLCNKICVPNKGEDLDLSEFNIITGIKELKTVKHISS